MSDLERLILEHGRIWFEWAGGPGWRGHLFLGLEALALTTSVLALVLAVTAIVIAIRKGGSE
jgi:hypothetical protein